MILKRKDFFEILNKLKPGIENNELIEQFECILFSKNTIQSYNDQINIVIPFETGLNAAVRANELLSLISKFPDTEIDISIKEDRQFFVKGKKIKAGINILSDFEMPHIRRISKWYRLPEDFSEAVNFSLFSTAKDMAIPYQSCLNVIDDRIITFDGYRGTIRKMTSGVGESFLLPNMAAKELIKFNPTEYNLSESWTAFTNFEENIVFRCRNIADDFNKDLDKFFSVTGNKVKLPKRFNEIVDRSQIMAGLDKEGDKFIRIKVHNNELICESKGDRGFIEEKVRVRYEGDSIDFMTSPEFLKDILIHLKEMIVGERLYFEGENFKHVICLTE